MIQVLIVEDDPMVSEINRRYLEKTDGFVLKAIASSVAEALTIIEKQEIDLILLDIFMPGLNGLELLTQIRKKGLDIDVILITAASDIQSIKKALQYGAIDYLIKPFTFDRFHAALSAYREEIKFLKEQDNLDQAELDKRILRKDRSFWPPELPKGLTGNTLKHVWENIQELNGNSFTTEEMASQVGISRVSMRKYLNFLHEVGMLEKEIIYGAVGRPVFVYRCVEKGDPFSSRL